MWEIIGYAIGCIITGISCFGIGYLKTTTPISVTRRSSDYHACLKGHEGIWGCGSSWPEAIGQAISNHPEKFRIKIEHK